MTACMWSSFGLGLLIAYQTSPWTERQFEHCDSPELRSINMFMGNGWVPLLLHFEFLEGRERFPELEPCPGLNWYWLCTCWMQLKRIKQFHFNRNSQWWSCALAVTLYRFFFYLLLSISLDNGLYELNDWVRTLWKCLNTVLSDFMLTCPDPFTLSQECSFFLPFLLKWFLSPGKQTMSVFFEH